MKKGEDCWGIEVKYRLLVDCRNAKRWLSVGSNQLCALSWTPLLSGALMRKSVSHLLLTLLKSMSIKYSYLLKYYDWAPCSELPLSWWFWELFHEILLFSFNRFGFMHSKSLSQPGCFHWNLSLVSTEGRVFAETVWAFGLYRTCRM